MTPSCPLNLTLGVFAVPSIESASIFCDIYLLFSLRNIDENIEIEKVVYIVIFLKMYISSLLPVFLCNIHQTQSASTLFGQSLMIQDELIHILQLLPTHGIDLINLVPQNIHFILSDKISGGNSILSSDSLLTTRIPNLESNSFCISSGNTSI